MTATDQSLVDVLSKGWTWWTGELASLLPAGQSASHSRAQGLVVVPQGSDFSLIDGRARNPVAGGKSVTGEAVWETLSAFARTRQSAPVVLQLPHSDCFVRRVEIPQALRADAGRFLGLDLERATPFRLKDVYTAHFASETGPEKPGMIALEQVVVRRDTVDRHIASIETTGAKVTAVEVLRADGRAPMPVDLLAAKQGSTAAGTAGRVSRVLTAAALVLTISAGTIALARHETALAELTAATNAARAKLQATQQVRDAEIEKSQEAKALLGLKSETVGALTLLEAITKLLPDSAWVTQLRMEGDTVEIAGQAESAAQLITAFENSGVFKGAAFTAPVTRDGDGKERFALTMQIASARPAVASPQEGEAP